MLSSRSSAETVARAARAALAACAALALAFATAATAGADTPPAGPAVGGIALDATGPAAATAGELITYDLAVTNTGGTSLTASGISLAGTAVSGGACATAPATPTTRNNDQTPGELNPGETWTYQCQVQTRAGAAAVTVVGAVSGTDAGGTALTATDTAETALAQPVAAVAGEVRVSGLARLTGSVGCVAAGHARASVTGSSIRKVTFYVNGRKVKTLTRANSGPRFQLVFATRSLKYGTHKVRAKVQFAANAVPQSRTLSLQFSRCRSRVVKPTFAG